MVVTMATKKKRATKRAKAPAAKPVLPTGTMTDEGVFFQMRIRRVDSDNMKWWAKQRGFKSVAKMLKALVQADFDAHRAEHGDPPHVLADPRQLTLPET